ncbi:unnamed protein product, partial [Symbiodinium microadriaticum]
AETKLFWDFVSARDAARAVCKAFAVCFFWLLENVVPASKHQRAMTAALGLQPLLLNAADTGWHIRRRLAWFNWDLPPQMEALVTYHDEKGFFVLSVPHSRRILPPLGSIFRGGWWPLHLLGASSEEFPEGRFAVMSRPLKPGMSPRGWSQASPEARERYQQSTIKFPVYHFEAPNLLWKDDSWRLANADERDQLFGLPSGYTKGVAYHVTGRLCPWSTHDISSKRGEAPNLPGGDSPQKRPRSGATPSLKGRGKGKQAGQRRKDGKNSETTEDNLVNAVAKLVIRHDEQLLAMTSDLCYISYVRTEAHSVLQELHEESQRQRGMMAPQSPPRHAMTLRFFQALKQRVMKVSQSEAVQQKLKQDGVLTMHGDWPYFEWSSDSQSMVESLEDPLSTSQLVSGLGDVISRLEADTTQVKMFKSSIVKAHRRQDDRLVEVLLPVLAALYHVTEVPSGSDSLPGSYITQAQTLIQAKMVKIKAQLFLLAAEILPADKLKRLHECLGQIAMMHYTMAKSRILGHTQSLLPDNIRHPFDLDAELTRQRFFREDAEFNAAIAEWDLKLSELVNEEW